MHECTQGESHPWQTVNTQDDPILSHIHHQEEQTTYQRPFVDHIMEADISLGWKPLNLDQNNGTTNLDEHLDTFLNQANLYTNDDSILCRVFPTSLKWAALTWYGGLPPRPINRLDCLVFCCVGQSLISRRWISHKIHGPVWTNCHPNLKSQPWSSTTLHAACLTTWQVHG